MLALLPTATENIIAELETERITYELQQQKAARLAKTSDGISDLGSTPPSVTDEDGRSMASMSVHSDSGMHISRLGIPTASATTGDGVQDGGQQAVKAKRSKLQLWNDLKISGMFSLCESHELMLICNSYHASLHADIYSCPPHFAHPNPTQPARSTKLPFKCCLPRNRWR